MVNKKRLNISVTPDTEERLKQYAWENHKNVSQAITDWIWSEKVKGDSIRGQQTMEIAKPSRKKSTKAEPEPDAKTKETAPEKPKRQSRSRKPKTEKPAEGESGEK